MSGVGATSIVVGPDGKLWFTESNALRLGSLTTSGVLTEFPAKTPGSPAVFPWEMTAGPDGNLWFTASNENQVVKVTPSGVLTAYQVPTPNSRPYGIVLGPDRNLWFTEEEGFKVVKLTVDGAFTEYPVPNSSFITEITAGPDGNLYFLDGGNVDKMPTSGVITKYRIPYTGWSGPGASGLAVGPDGNLWFTESPENKVVRMTTSGVFTEAKLPPTPVTPMGVTTTYPQGITAGPDGNLWVTELGNDKVARITPSGVITEIPLPALAPYDAHCVLGNCHAQPNRIVAGPDGNMWFTMVGGIIGKISLPGPAA